MGPQKLKRRNQHCLTLVILVYAKLTSSEPQEISPFLSLAIAIGRVSIEPPFNMGWMCPNSPRCFFFNKTKSPHPRQLNSDIIIEPYNIINYSMHLRNLASVTISETGTWSLSLKGGGRTDWEYVWIGCWEEFAGGWRKVLNEEIHTLCASPHIICAHGTDKMHREL